MKTIPKPQRGRFKINLYRHIIANDALLLFLFVLFFKLHSINNCFSLFVMGAHRGHWATKCLMILVRLHVCFITAPDTHFITARFCTRLYICVFTFVSLHSDTFVMHVVSPIFPSPHSPIKLFKAKCIMGNNKTKRKYCQILPVIVYISRSKWTIQESCILNTIFVRIWICWHKRKMGKWT